MGKARGRDSKSTGKAVLVLMTEVPYLGLTSRGCEFLSRKRGDEFARDGRAGLLADIARSSSSTRCVSSRTIGLFVSFWKLGRAHIDGNKKWENLGLIWR